MSAAPRVLTSFPVVYVVPGLSRIAVPAGVVGADGTLTPGTSAVVPFSFPAPREVTGLLVVPATGDPNDLGGLSLQIIDQDDEPIFTDHAGDARLPRLPFAMPCLSLNGRGFHPFPLSKVVGRGRLWRLTLRNTSLAIINTATVAIFHREIS